MFNVKIQMEKEKYENQNEHQSWIAAIWKAGAG
jgi:hypothetical protein